MFIVLFLIILHVCINDFFKNNFYKTSENNRKNLKILSKNILTFFLKNRKHKRIFYYQMCFLIFRKQRIVLKNSY